MNNLPAVWNDVAAVAAGADGAGGAAIPAQEGFRSRLVDRFRKDKGTMSLVDALSRLIQKPSEGVEDFFDRCVLAYSKLNVDFVNKAALDYQMMLNRSVFNSFLGGMRQEIKGLIMSRVVRPNTSVELRTAAVEVELSLKPTLKNVSEVTAIVTVEEKSEVAAILGLNPEQIDVLSKFFGKGPKRGQAGGSKAVDSAKDDKKCFYCEKVGHYARDCFAKKRDEGRKGREGKEKEGKEKEKKKGEAGKEGKAKKPFRKFVHANALEFDEEANGFFFNTDDAKPAEEPSEEAEN